MNIKTKNNSLSFFLTLMLIFLVDFQLLSMASTVFSVWQFSNYLTKFIVDKKEADDDNDRDRS